MEATMPRCLLVVAVSVVAVASARAEDVRLQRAIPVAVLERVLQIRVGDKLGSGFVVDLDERQYLITAKHLVTTRVTRQIQILANGEWTTLRVRPIFPANPQVDIVALAPDKPIARRMTIVAGSDGLAIGQDVYFLGFPYGLATQLEQPVTRHLPFVKKAILSAVDDRRDSGGVLYLDGHNNPGFSGGPVIFANYTQQDRLQIAGVVSAYRNQRTEVFEEIVPVPSSPTDSQEERTIRFVRENSGIVVA